MISNVLTKAFENTAPDYDRVGILPQMVGERLLGRLDDFSEFQPSRVLDLGCGTGYCLKSLYALYPDAQFMGVDCSYPLLLKAREKLTSPSLAQFTLIQSDIQQPLFIPEQFDLICANLALLWIEQPMHYLTQLKSWLKPGGLLIATWLGIDTLRNLRPHKTTIHEGSHPTEYPWGFCDLHTLGDMLIKAQWEKAVVNVNHFLLRYPHQQAMYTELEQLGFHTLVSRSSQDILRENMESDTDYSIQWEIIFGHAWKPETSRYHNNSGEVAIPIHQLHRNIPGKTTT